MLNIEQDISTAIAFIFDENRSDPRYKKVWYGATEAIKEYFELLEWTKTQRVLTVCSSGDHPLNLVNKGIKQIDTFDINPLTFPYLNLRIGLILAFSYREYFKYFEKLTIASRNEKEEYEIFRIIKPFIKEPYDYFWEQLYRENMFRNEHNIMTPGLLARICHQYEIPRTSKSRNLYLSSEEEYERTKRNLKDAKISFKCANIFDIPTTFSGPYDKIFLSNISDYLMLPCNNTFHSFITNDLASMINDHGEILAAYIYHYISSCKFIGIHFKDSLDDNYRNFESNYDLLQFPHIDELGNIEYGSSDALLRYRKK